MKDDNNKVTPEIIEFLKQYWLLIIILLSFPCCFVFGSIFLSASSLSSEIFINNISVAFSGEKTFFGFNLSNSIALLASFLALVGVLYITYKDNLRTEKQLINSRWELNEQLNRKDKEKAIFRFVKEIMDICNNPFDDHSSQFNRTIEQLIRVAEAMIIAKPRFFVLLDRCYIII